MPEKKLDAALQEARERETLNSYARLVELVYFPASAALLVSSQSEKTTPDDCQCSSIIASRIRSRDWLVPADLCGPAVES